MTDYEKLKNITDEIDDLTKNNITSEAAEFQAWKTKAERFLINKFGQDSYEHRVFSKTYFSAISFSRDVSYGEKVGACKKGLEKTKAIFLTYLEDLNANTTATTTLENNKNYDKVFIVHGHDGEMKNSVARIIAEQGIKPIILSEQANQGRTIIEKFEDYSDVGGAICLFTADDIGKAKNDSSDNTRARQNVVLETGYFMGKLGRNRTVILADEGIEMPSDLSGVVYTDTTNWQVDLLKELKTMGYAVDFNKLF